MFGILDWLSLGLELSKTKKLLQKEAKELVKSLQNKTVEEIEERFLNKPIPVAKSKLGQLVLMVSLSNEKPATLMFHLTSFKAGGKRYIIWGGIKDVTL